MFYACIFGGDILEVLVAGIRVYMNTEVYM